MADIILFPIYVESMHMVVEILFWACFSIIFYTYLGYPLLLCTLVKLRKIRSRSTSPPKVPSTPVTLVVTAYNEEKIILKKILDCQALDYPPQLLSLLFVTDGSSDATPQIVSAYPEITLLHQPERRGKLAAMNRAIGHVHTPITIFSDANTFLNPDCVKYIVAHYDSPEVGGVAGEKQIIKDGSRSSVSEGEGVYWKYESFLKKLDSDLKTTVGAAGELFSIRTGLYTTLPEDTIIEDFVQSLLLCTRGYVVRYEPKALSMEYASQSVQDEMERKIRISAGAFQAMAMLRPLFNVFRYPLVSFQFISHRVLRWTICPAALVVLFAASAALSYYKGYWFYVAFTMCQVIFYGAAAAGWLFARQNRRIRAFYLPFYFVFMNLCVFAGLYRYLNKSQTVLWEAAGRHGG